MTRKKVIAIDFDGTIVEADYPSIGRPIEGALESIARIQELGAEVIIWTCRSGKQLDEAKAWLKSNGVDVKFINENTTVEIEEWGTDPRKVAADRYVDDRIIGGFPGWTKVMRHLEVYLS
jgi:hydroxymethylpyrimidine pyrophosphatase-like HAD family hydrolase